MKSKFFVLAIYCCFAMAFGGRFKSENKKITKGYVLVPAGRIAAINIDEFYISSIEITNKQYREFLNDIRSKGESEKLKDATVDSAKWSNSEIQNEPYVKYYFNHPAYDNYPVVNVSKRGAELYCAWLTDRYNSSSSNKVKFELPTEAQWMLAAKAGNASAVYPWEGNSLTMEKNGRWHGEYLCNYRVERKGNTVIKFNVNADITAPCGSYWPNGYGIYNMSGNVAEMIAGKDITKGGSWHSKADKVTIDSQEEYSSSLIPAPTVGFRPVMAVAR